MALLGSGMSNANSHSNRDLPILLAGGGFKHGQHLHFARNGRQSTPLCNLYLSMLQNFGLDLDQYNTSSELLQGSKKLAKSFEWEIYSILRFGACFYFFPIVNLSHAKVLELDSSVFEFTNKYCIQCHGPEKQKGDRSFHQLSERISGKQVIDLSKEEKIHLLQDLLDQLNLGEMPPKEDDVRQPSTEEIKHTITWLTDTLLKLEKEQGPKKTVLRRLNRREYRNTMRDLLGLDDLPFDFTENFPTDEKEHGFVNIGDSLNLSDQHLNAYLDAADKYLRMAFRFVEPAQPKTQNIKPKEWGYPQKQDKTPWMYRVYQPGKFLDFAAGKKQLSDHFDLGTFPHEWYQKNRGIQVSGYYKLSLKAEAVRRLSHPYDSTMIPTNLNPPMQLAFRFKRQERFGVRLVKSRSKVGLWDLADHQTKKFEVIVWMDQGCSFH